VHLTALLRLAGQQRRWACQKADSGIETAICNKYLSFALSIESSLIGKACYHQGMRKLENNYAFIDGQNLYFAIKTLGWNLDYKKFRVYLREKYGVEKAFIFIGYLAANTDLYTALQSHGFILIFRPTLTYKDGTVKGNCDAELVLQAMIEYARYDKALIVTGDGDFYCLVKYLKEKNKLKTLLIPDMKKYSALLKKVAEDKIAFINPLQNKLEYKKRTP
jgi:uncharacterized LabA/DUF88 family protein